MAYIEIKGTSVSIEIEGRREGEEASPFDTHRRLCFLLAFTDMLEDATIRSVDNIVERRIAGEGRLKLRAD